MRYQAALRPDIPHRLYREWDWGVRDESAARSGSRGVDSEGRFDATIERKYGGYSSAAERLTVAQDVVGSIPTSRPNLKSTTYEISPLPACNECHDCVQFRGQNHGDAALPPPPQRVQSRASEWSILRAMPAGVALLKALAKILTWGRPWRLHRCVVFRVNPSVRIAS
jgi:hypothetical protein